MGLLKKRYVTGVLLIPGILGVVAHGTTFSSNDKKKVENKQEKIVQTPANNISNSGTMSVSDNLSTNNNEGISPYIGLTEFKDSFSELDSNADEIHIHTNSKGSGTALLQAYRQEITIDPSIADEFFNTTDFQKYIKGTVTRTKDSLFGGTKSFDIQSELWDNSTWLGSVDTMNYDSKKKVLYYTTAQYGVQILGGVQIEVDMKIDMKQWAKDTGRLVERKPNYSVKAKTDANSLAVGFTNEITGSLSSDDNLNSWIENPVEDTTLYTLKEKNSYFYGNGLQDEVNEHPTDYEVELMVNGTPYKTVKMATKDGGTNSRGEEIKKGDWDFDFGSYLGSNDVVTARVKGTEEHSIASGEVPVKYSSTVLAEDSTNIVSWEDWKVGAPTVPTLYADDLIIPVHTSIQNQQLNRSYKLIVTVNDVEVYNKNVKDDMDINVPYLSGLAEGDVVKSKIVGSQAGEADKSSDETTAVVIIPDSEGYEDWQVQTPTINGPIYAGGDMISGSVPIQNRAAGRNYDLQVYIGDELVIDEKNIDVALKGYNYSYSLSSIEGIHHTSLEYGEKIKAVVTGHQPDADNGTKYADKSSETEITVSDNTGYDAWNVEQPTLDKAADTDNSISGNIGSQNTDFGRNYEVEIKLNDQKSVNVKPNADGSFKLDNVSLKEGDKINAKVIGLQSGRDNKESSTATESVTDGTNYSAWVVQKPTVNALENGKKMITGSIGDQNKDFNRSYDVEVLVNGTSQGKATVTADGNFTTKEIDLNEGDKVVAIVTGHQPGKADKNATSDEVVVADSSHYDTWTVEAASIDEVHVHDKKITGTIPTEDDTNGRTYEVIASVDGNEVGRTSITAGQTSYTVSLPDTTDLSKDQTVSVQVVGHQDGKADKLSTKTSETVEEEVFTTNSNFKNGYWKNYGLVYEGQIDNKGWDMSTSSKVSMAGQLVNHTTGEVKTSGIETSVTNWYDSARYNGYQIIISNDVLGKLDAGEYTIQLTVSVDGQTKETIDLALDQLVARMGPMHDNYADLEKVVIERNTVTPQIIDNKPGFTIAKDLTQSVQIFNKYWNDEDQLVFEGFVDTTTDLTGEGVTKKLIIKDTSGNVVDERQVFNFTTSWGVATNVPEAQSFQAIVPNAYSNQTNYTYELVYSDSKGTALLTEVIK